MWRRGRVRDKFGMPEAIGAGPLETRATRCGERRIKLRVELLHPTVQQAGVSRRY
jgi:hypothetical protein